MKTIATYFPCKGIFIKHDFGLQSEYHQQIIPGPIATTE